MFEVMPTVALIRRLGSLLACLAAFAFGSAPADAAPTWLAPLPLSPTATGEISARPEVASDAAGDAFAIWQRTSGADEVIESSVRPAGASWQAPESLTAPEASGFNAQIAVDPGGEALATWETPASGKEIVQAAVRPPGGGWSAPVTLSAHGEAAQRASVAIGADGEAVAVWENAVKGGEFTVEAAAHAAGGGWQAAHALSPVGTIAALPQVAVDADGEALAVWAQSRETIESAARPAGGEWQLPVTLSSLGPAVTEPELAIDPQGVAAAVWDLVPSGKASEATVRAAIRGAAREWTREATLSEAGAVAPAVAIDAGGDATAVWQEANAPTAIEASRRPAGGGWQGLEAVSAPGEAVGEPSVSADRQGDAIALWRRAAGTSPDSGRGPPGGGRMAAPGEPVDPRRGSRGTAGRARPLRRRGRGLGAVRRTGRRPDRGSGLRRRRSPAQRSRLPPRAPPDGRSRSASRPSMCGRRSAARAGASATARARAGRARFTSTPPPAATSSR